MPVFAAGLFVAATALVWAPGFSPVWFLFLCLIGLLGAWLVRQRLLWLGGFCLGLLLASHAIHERLMPSALDDLGEQTVVVTEGRVLGLVADHGFSQRFDFQVDVIDGEPLARPVRLRVSWSEPLLAPASGEQWRLPLQLREPAARPLPGQFDQARWQFRHGLAGTARVMPEATAVRLEPGGAGMDRLRTRLGQAVAESLADSPASALIRGITVGDRSGFDSGQWAVLNATGTTHLVAISGLHIGMVGGLVFLLGQGLARLLPAPWPARLSGALLGLAAAGAYAMLAGFALPTVRALSMFAVMVLLLLLRRRTGFAGGLATAAVVVLVLDPLAVMDPGFYLSFALVAFVLAVVAGGDRPGRAVAFVRIQWVTGLAILPVLMLFFGLGPLSSPLANAIAVPLFSFLVVPLSLLGAALSLGGLDTLAAWFWSGAGLVLDGLWPVLSLLAELPALPTVAGYPLIAALLALLAILAVVLPGPRVARAALLLGLLPLVVGLNGRDQPDIRVWSLPAGGQVWQLDLAEERLIWLQAGRGDLRGPLLDWLARAMRRPGSRLLFNPEQGVGSATLDHLQSSLPELAPGQFLLPDLRGMPAGVARHCPQGAMGGDEIYFVRGPGQDGLPQCQLLAESGDWRLRLDPSGLVVEHPALSRPLHLDEGLAREKGRVGLRLEGRGEVAYLSRQPRWWRP